MLGQAALARLADRFGNGAAAGADLAHAARLRDRRRRARRRGRVGRARCASSARRLPALPARRAARRRCSGRAAVGVAFALASRSALSFAAFSRRFSAARRFASASALSTAGSPSCGSGAAAAGGVPSGTAAVGGGGVASRSLARSALAAGVGAVARRFLDDDRRRGCRRRRVGVAATGGVTLVGTGAATGGAGFDVAHEEPCRRRRRRRARRRRCRRSAARDSARGGFWNAHRGVAVRFVALLLAQRDRRVGIGDVGRGLLDRRAPSGRCPAPSGRATRSRTTDRKAAAVRAARIGRIAAGALRRRSRRAGAARGSCRSWRSSGCRACSGSRTRRRRWRRCRRRRRRPPPWRRAKAVPQARQNWASSLFSVPHTEQSLLIRSASAPSSDGRRTIPCFIGPRNLVRPSGDGQCVNCAARRGSCVLYAFLKAFHLLAVVVWIGGMAFMLFCLRPAARVLEPPARVTLMHAAMQALPRRRRDRDRGVVRVRRGDGRHRLVGGGARRPRLQHAARLVHDDRDLLRDARRLRPHPQRAVPAPRCGGDGGAVARRRGGARGDPLGGLDQPRPRRPS